MNQDPTASLGTQPSLLLRLRNWEDEASWNHFHRLYRKLVYGMARRAGLRHPDAEEVTQDVFRSVAQKIDTFESDPQRGSFRGWLMNLTRWRILDKLSAIRPLPRAESFRSDEAGDGTATVERIPAPPAFEAEWEAEWQRGLLDAAVMRLARRVKPRHLQVFDLYVRQRWPVLRISSELGINPASVYLIGHRLTQQVRAEVAKLHGHFG